MSSVVSNDKEKEQLKVHLNYKNLALGNIENTPLLILYHTYYLKSDFVSNLSTIYRKRKVL